jgi:hypothetical protein
MPGMLVLVSGASAHGTTVAEADAIRQVSVNAKKTFEASGFAALAKQSKAAIEPVTAKPDWAKATQAMCLYLTGCFIYQDAPPAARQAGPAAYFSPASASEVVNRIILANGFRQEDVRKVFLLDKISYLEVFGKVKPGVLAPRLELVGTIQRATSQAMHALSGGGINGLKELCVAKGEAVKKERGETAAIEYISMVLYGSRKDSEMTKKDRLAKPNPYFSDPMASISDMLKPFNGSNAQALATFVNSEIDDAITALNEDDDDDQDPHCG